MSYILDALNKAEKERQLGTVPTLDSRHQNQSSEQPKHHLTIIVSVLLLLNVVFIIYYFYPKNESTSLANTTVNSTDSRSQHDVQRSGQSQNSQNSQKNIIQNNAAPQSKSSAQVKSNTNKPATIDDMPSPVSTLAKKNTSNENIAPNTAAANIAPSSIAPKNQTSENVVAATQAEDQAKIDKPITSKDIASKAIIETPNKDISNNKSNNKSNIESNYEEIPFLAEKSASFQQTVPDLKIDVHVYSETPANRFVLINLKRYEEDDQIAKGLLIEAITEEGLILSLNQEKFRFPMLLN